MFDKNIINEFAKENEVEILIKIKGLDIKYGDL